MAERYRWQKGDEVVPAQAKTAAYIDANGDLVIRQGQPGYAEDAVLTIAQANRRDFVTRLVEIIKADEVACRKPPAVRPEPRPAPGQARLKLVEPTDQ